MKNFILYSLFVFTTLGITACGGDTTQQLETEKAEIQEKFKKMESEVARLEGVEQQLTALTATVAGNEQIQSLMTQYKAISNSLTGAMRRYDSAVNQYNLLIESAGTKTEAELATATKALQGKLEQVTNKSEMTLTELERMKVEIETAVEKAKTAN